MTKSHLPAGEGESVTGLKPNRLTRSRRKVGAGELEAGELSLPVASVLFPLL